MANDPTPMLKGTVDLLINEEASGATRPAGSKGAPSFGSDPVQPSRVASHHHPRDLERPLPSDLAVRHHTRQRDREPLPSRDATKPAPLFLSIFYMIYPFGHSIAHFIILLNWRFVIIITFH